MEIVRIDVEEDFDESLVAEQIPVFLAEKKGKAFTGQLAENELLVTADTVVWLNDHVLNKPVDLDDAFRMLKNLSGHKHTVYTGVSVRSAEKQISFYEASDVFFNPLSDDMIRYYLENHKPLDKAGAYGIQEFIGYIGIRKIDGCYYNVMGFPVSRFIHEIQHL
jgi:septum formation protein